MVKNRLLNLTVCRNFQKTDPSFALGPGIFERGENTLSICQNNFSSILHYEQAGQSQISVIVAGSPLWNGRVDRAGIAKHIQKNPDALAFVRDLDGEFLIFVWNGLTGVLDVYTDRLGSYPLFWAINDTEFCLSYAYIDLVRYCRNWSGFRLLPERAFEFIMMQRLFGTQTHDTITQMLPLAAWLRIGPDRQPKIQQYWVQNYTKNTTASRRELINDFSQKFEHAVVKRQGDAAEHTGIFLSGGHDSRLVAAYAKPQATCYTLSFAENLEVRAARAIADVAGHRHQYCQLAPNFFEDVFDTAAELSGALYTTDHALFLGQGLNPVPQADVFLHGHGLDFMYQGMYLHAQSYEIFNRHTYLRRFMPFPADVPDHFIHTISVRLKYDMRGQLLRTEQAKPFEETLYSTISDIYHKACALADDPMDRWEYMIFHQPTKHHTYSNVLSKRMCGELRTPSFDRDIYDFYLALPHQYRLHGDILRGAMYKKNPRIANLPTANNALPAGWGPYTKTGYLLLRKLLRHATLNRFFHVPAGNDRTWPDRDTYFRTHDAYRHAALSPLQDQEFMDFLPFIDWQRLRDDQATLMRQPLIGAFLVTLLSYYKFYRSVYQRG